MAGEPGSGYTPPSDVAARASALDDQLRAAFAAWEAGDQQQVDAQDPNVTVLLGNAKEGEGPVPDPSIQESLVLTSSSFDTPTRQIPENFRGNELRKPRKAERARADAYVRAGYTLVGVDKNNRDILLNGPGGTQYRITRDDVTGKDRFYAQQDADGRWVEVSGADPTRVYPVSANHSSPPSPARPQNRANNSARLPSAFGDELRGLLPPWHDQTRIQTPPIGSPKQQNVAERGMGIDTSALTVPVDGPPSPSPREYDPYIPAAEDAQTIVARPPGLFAWGMHALRGRIGGIQARMMHVPPPDALPVPRGTYGQQQSLERVGVAPFHPDAKVSDIRGRVLQDGDLFPTDIEITIDGNRGYAPAREELIDTHHIAGDTLALQAVFRDGTWRLVDRNLRPYLRSSQGDSWQRLTSQGTWEGIVMDEVLIDELRNIPATNRHLAAIPNSVFYLPDGKRVWNQENGRVQWEGDALTGSWSDFDKPIPYTHQMWEGWPVPEYGQRAYAPDPRPADFPSTVPPNTEASRDMEQNLGGAPMSADTSDTRTSHPSRIDGDTRMGGEQDFDPPATVEDSTQVREPIQEDPLAENRVNAVVDAINEIVPQFDPQANADQRDFQQIYAAFDNFTVTLNAIRDAGRNTQVAQQALRILGVPADSSLGNLTIIRIEGEEEIIERGFADQIVQRLQKAKRVQEMTLQEMQEQDSQEAINEARDELIQQLNIRFLERAIPGLRLDTSRQVPPVIEALDEARRTGDMQPLNNSLEQLATGIREQRIGYTPSSADTFVPKKFDVSTLPQADSLLDVFKQFEAEYSRDGYYPVHEREIEGRVSLTLAERQEDLDAADEENIRQNVLDALSDRVPALEGEALQEFVERMGSYNGGASRDPLLLPFVRAISAGPERDEEGVQAVRQFFAARRNPDRFIEEAQAILHVEVDTQGREVLQTIQRMVGEVGGDDRLWAQVYLYRLLHLANEYRNSADLLQPMPLPELALVTFATSPEVFKYYIWKHYGEAAIAALQQGQPQEDIDRTIRGYQEQIYNSGGSLDSKKISILKSLDANLRKGAPSNADQVSLSS